MKFSKFSILLLLPLLIAAACTTPSEINVSHSGALMEIMSGNIQGTISLKTLKDTKNLYALGALENLQGEIQIFNGEVNITSVEGNSVLNSNSMDEKAALLVYASVERWNETEIPADIKTMNDLEAFVRSTATSEGIPTDKPFPFLVEGKAKYVDYHIIKWDVNDTVHTHAKHQKSGLKDQLTNVPATMLGFYSEGHKGVFTHHSTNMHIHFKAEDDPNGIAGHVDDFSIGSGMILKLPKL